MKVRCRSLFIHYIFREATLSQNMPSSPDPKLHPPPGSKLRHYLFLSRPLMLRMLAQGLFTQRLFPSTCI